MKSSLIQQTHHKLLAQNPTSAESITDSNDLQGYLQQQKIQNNLLLPSQLNNKNSNKVHPILKDNNNSPIQPIEVQTFGLNRGKTFFKEDSNYLMPFKNQNSQNNQSQVNKQNKTQVTEGNSSTQDKDEGGLQESKSTAGFGFFKRMLSGNLNNKPKRQESLGQSQASGQNQALKRSATDMKPHNSARVNANLSNRGNSKVLNQKNKAVDTESVHSYDTQKIRAYLKKPSFGRQANKKEIHKSKELFNILKVGAFQQDSEQKNEAISKMHVLDMNRISKMNSLRRSRQGSKASKEEKNKRRDQFTASVIDQIANKLQQSNASLANSFRESQGKVSIRKKEEIVSDGVAINLQPESQQLTKRNEKSPGQSINTSLISQGQQQKIQKSSSFIPARMGRRLEDSSTPNTLQNSQRDNNLSVTPDSKVQNNLKPQQQNLLIQPKTNKTAQSKIMRSITHNVKRKIKQSTVNQKKEMTIEELRNQIKYFKTIRCYQLIILEEQKIKHQKSHMKKTFREDDDNDGILDHQNTCCCWSTLNSMNNNDSENISSDDCKENSKIFLQMDKENEKDHLYNLWRKCYIKAIAGANVLNLFNDLSKKIYLFGLSNGYSQIEMEQHIPIYILMPSDRFRSIWNIINIVLLLYTAIFMPYKVAFVDQDSTVSSSIDWFVDGLFFLDIIITFFTAYEELDGSLQFQGTKIARNYLGSTFLIDVIACFPFQVFADTSKNKNKGNYQKLLRLLRLPRLFKMLRVIKVLRQIKFLRENKTFNKVLKKLKMNTAITRMIQGMVASVIITHFFACFWFMTSKFDDYNPDTWVYRIGIIDEDSMIQYLLALYWSTQTVITVGYGDIPAVSSGEMIISLFWMVFGVGFYSFIIGNYSSIIQSNIQIQASIQQRIKSLAELAKKANIPIDLTKRIKRFIENNFEAIYNQDDEAQLVKMLPPSLRDEVLSNSFGEIISNINFFKEMKDPDFLWKILPLLRPIKLEKGDILYWRGDHAEDIYFIQKGSIRLYTSKGYPFIKYKDGDFFGDSDTLLNLPRDGKAIALTHLKLLVLKIDQMFENSFENQEKNFMSMIFNARKKRNYHLRLIKQENKKYKNKKKYNILQKRTWNAATIFDLTTDDANKNSQGDQLTQQDSGFLSSFKNKIVNTFKPRTPRGNQDGNKSSFLSIFGKRTDGTKNTEQNSPSNSKSQNTETDGNFQHTFSNQQLNSKQDQKILATPGQQNIKLSSNQNSNIISNGFQSLGLNRDNSGNLKQDLLILDERNSNNGGSSPANGLINFRSQSVNSQNIRENLKVGTQLSVILENEANTPNKRLINRGRGIPTPISQKGSDPQNSMGSYQQTSKRLQLQNHQKLNSQYIHSESANSLIQGLGKDLQIHQNTVETSDLQQLMSLQQDNSHKNRKATILDRMLSQVFDTDNVDDVKSKFNFLKRLNEDAIVEKSESYLTESEILSSYRKVSKRASLQHQALDSLVESYGDQFKQSNTHSKKNSNLQTHRVSSNLEDDDVSILQEDNQFMNQAIFNVDNIRQNSDRSSGLRLSPEQKKINLTLSKINEDIQNIESKNASVINLNINVQVTKSPEKDKRQEMIDIPRIVIQERLNQSRDTLNLQNIKASSSPINFNDKIQSPLLDIRMNLRQLDKNILQLPSANYGAQSSKSDNNEKLKEANQFNIQQPQKRIPRSLDPSPHADYEKNLQLNQKKRTESLRLVIQRPSFSIMKQNPTIIDNVNSVPRNQFISPISLQRINNFNNNTLNQTYYSNQVSQNQDDYLMLKPKTTHKKDTKRGASFTTSKKSLQEAVSQVFEQKNSLRMHNLALTGKYRSISKEKTPIGNLQQEGKLLSKQTFTDALKIHQKRRQQSTQNQNQKQDFINNDEEYYRNIEDQNKFLDEQLLLNQSDDLKIPLDMQNQQELQETLDNQVSNIRQYLVEEIQKKFSKNINQEYFKLQSRQASQSSNYLLNNNQYIIGNGSEQLAQSARNQNSIAPSTTIYSQLSQPNIPYQKSALQVANPFLAQPQKLITNSPRQMPQNNQYLNFDNAQDIYQKMWENSANRDIDIVVETNLPDNKFQMEDEEIQFYGDPAMVGLVQFNADMGHIAMNIFETFTVFDLITKSNHQVNESIQLIQAQNDIISQRQWNIDNNIDEMENKFEMIKQLKAFKSEHNLKQQKKQLNQDPVAKY